MPVKMVMSDIHSKMRGLSALLLCTLLACIMTACGKKVAVQIPHERSDRLLEIFDDIYKKDYAKAAKDVDYYATNIERNNAFLNALSEKMHSNGYIAKTREIIRAGKFQEALDYLESPAVADNFKQVNEDLYSDTRNALRSFATIERCLNELNKTQDAKAMRHTAETLKKEATRNYIKSKKLQEYADAAIVNSEELAKLESDRRTRWMEVETEKAIADDDYIRFCVGMEMLKRLSPDVDVEKLNLLENTAKLKSSEK